ncbi:MAG: S8 family serine peptidase [Eubacterium sp.]|nr:S8 family serine peptidase [Eubacterium sp.]
MNKLKKTSAIMLSLLMALSICPVSASASAIDTNDANEESKMSLPEFKPGQLIVVTERETTKSDIQEMVDEVDGEVDHVTTLNDGARVALVEVEDGSELMAVNAINDENKVLFAQPNYTYEFTEVDGSQGSDYPNDPAYQDDKMLYLSEDPFDDEDYAGSINAAGAWEQLGNTSLPEDEKVLIGIVDTGVRRTHVDLQGGVLKDECVTFNDGVQKDFRAVDNSDDDIGHGTSVTGIIVADINNGIGGAGIAGGRAKAIVVDAGSVTKGIDSIDIVMGIKYLADKGVRVINLSVGGYSRDLLFEMAVKYAWEKGALCVCAAGNSGSNFIHTPGDTPYAICVMAHELDGTPSSFSCYGVERDVSAPGSYIYTTSYLRNTSYETFDGTSASCPVVTAAAALLISAKPDLTIREIKNLLYTSSGNESFSAEKSGQSFGRINLNTAMRNLLSEKTAPEQIVLNKEEISLYEGMDTSIEYAVYPGNTDNAKATFKSSAENVVSVDDEGILVAKSVGQADITVTCGDVSEVCSVTVKEKSYKTVDKKPFVTSDTFTMDDMMDVVATKTALEDTPDMDDLYYHEYHIDLEKDETITALMFSNDTETFLRIKDMDDNIIATDNPDKKNKESKLCYKAEKAGTYKLQAIQVNGSGTKSTTDYSLYIVSDKVFCSPKVTSKDYGQLRFAWQEVDNTDCYLVRKYKDKDLKTVISEEYIDGTKYIDTDYNEKEDQYYSVTACKQSIAGMLLNGESVLEVKADKPQEEKLDNTLTVKGKKANVKAKTLKTKKVTLVKSKVLKVSKAQGKITYAKKSGNKKITINKKTGKVTIKKGLKKGTYKIKIKVTAAGNDKYKKATKTVTAKIIVK